MWLVFSRGKLPTARLKRENMQYSHSYSAFKVCGVKDNIESSLQAFACSAESAYSEVTSKVHTKLQQTWNYLMSQSQMKGAISTAAASSYASWDSAVVFYDQTSWRALGSYLIRVPETPGAGLTSEADCSGASNRFEGLTKDKKMVPKGLLSKR